MNRIVAMTVAAAAAVSVVQAVDTGSAIAGGEATVEIKAQATLVPPSGGRGYSFFDTARLVAPDGSPAPTGSVTFDAWGPFRSASEVSAASCAGEPAYSSSETVGGNEQPVLSNTFVPSPGEAKTYVLRATYSGDAVYSMAASECGAPGETIEVPLVALAVPEPPGSSNQFPSPTPHVGVESPSIDITHFDFSPRSFAVGPLDGRRQHYGSDMKFTLSADGRVRVRFLQYRLGIRGHGSADCAMPHGRHAEPSRRRCVIRKLVGQRFYIGHSGRDVVYFDGWLGGKKLKPGKYEAQARVSPIRVTAPESALRERTTFTVTR